MRVVAARAMIPVMAIRKGWTHDDLLVAFRLYCRMPFGKLDQRNVEIINLARLMGRTPSSVSMKACNFASLDPVQRARKIKGLANASRSDRQLWEAFQENAEATAAEAEAAYARLVGADSTEGETEIASEPELIFPTGPTEVTRTVRARRVQGFFRAAVLASYEFRCAVSGIAIPELLNASHIIPWQEDTKRRADPCNGIALNTLYDRAFDRGLITFDESLRLVLSNRLKTKSKNQEVPTLLQQCFHALEGTKLNLPKRFTPDPAALAYHREAVFR
ncbi:MAG: HNH endonuclease [Phycisphaerae bacterium]